MEARKITEQYRLSGWAEQVKERIASGKTVKTYCEENGIKENTYYTRQKKVREAACKAIAENRQTKPQNTGWAQITAATQVAEEKNTLTVEINGCRIEVTESIDVELLTKTCRALKAI